MSRSPLPPVVRALLPFALHGLAREWDAALGVILHSSLDLPGVLRDSLRVLDAAHTVRVVALWTAAGALLWLLLAAVRVRRTGVSWWEARAAEALGCAPLYLRPALSLLALASVALRPTFPYAFTLPVALTQDWGPAQDVAALAAVVALRAPRIRLSAPSPASLAFVAFLAYALLAPAAARRWDGHPGNEPKTLRMAVAVGHWLSLDVEGVSGPMEELPTRPFGASLGQAARTLGRESKRLCRALASGPGAVGASAIQATRITRQTVRGKEGGVFHVLAPGPSVLLAPALRIDRALNRWRATPGHLGVTLLFWNVLAALLVAAVYRLLLAATGRRGLAAALAAGAGLVPPFIFYSFQFYPEMLGALVLALLLVPLFFARWWRGSTVVVVSLLLAVLPWLHQKFLPVWLLLAAVALVRVVGQMMTARDLLALLVPQAVSGWLFLLYNFAITGSARPDALFLAWGPGGVSGQRIGQGLLGLLLDARYGLLPYVPIFLMSAGGLLLSGAGPASLRRALPAAVVYYVTVASADNWSGAVCNLGRYVMPIVPYLAALVAVSLARTGRRAGLETLGLMLAGWTGLLAFALWRDPAAANDCGVLLARSAFADGNLYVPNLFLRTWSDAAPGLLVRIAVWVAFVALLAAVVRRADRTASGGSALAALTGVVSVALAAALLLERWPSPHRAARFPNAVAIGPGATAFLDGPVSVRSGAAVARSGELELLVRARAPLPSVVLHLGGPATMSLAGRPPVPVGPSGADVAVSLTHLVHLEGRRGVEEDLYRGRLRLETSQEVPLSIGPGISP